MKKISLIIAVALMMLLSGCAALRQAAPQGEAEYRKITAEQAQGMLDESDGCILLDVRTDEEFEAQHIEGAMLIPDTEIASRIGREIPDKSAVILVYCRSGRRSALAAQEMISMGYAQVYDFGGIIDWPYKTVSDID